MEKIDPQNIENILALTPMQEGMLFHYLKDPRSGFYFEQLSLEISGTIDARVFEKAWNVIVQSNEMLRTVFRWEKVEKPSQVILKEHACEIRFHDFSDIDDCQKKTALAKSKTNDRNEGFDLTRVPFRVTLCKLNETQYEMIISNHHILYDGWSNGIILKEFFSAYRALNKGEGFIPPVKTKFKEFVRWIQRQDTAKQQKFWENYLKGYEVLDTLSSEPAAAMRIKKETVGETSNVRFQFPAELENKLDTFIKSNNITMASLLYSAWGILLQTYHSTNDIIFDGTVSGRSTGTTIKGIEDIVGLFINTLPLRIQTLPGETVSTFLSRIYHMLQQWSEFENSPTLPVREMLDKCHRETLFDSVVVIENYPQARLTARETAPLSLHSFSIVERTLYDLTVIITTLGKIELNITYNSDIFAESDISRLFNHLILIIEKIVLHPEQDVSGIKVWAEGDRETFLEHIRSFREKKTGIEIEYTAPRGQVEEKLVEIWSDVLNISQAIIGIDHNFFDFGGHSLKAFLLVNAIHKELQVKLKLSEVFSNPTPRELAGFIDRKKGNGEKYKSIEPAEKKKYYALSSAQMRLYMIHRLDPENTVYNGAMALIATGPLDKNKTRCCFKTLIQRHESLRTSFIEIQGRPVQKINENIYFFIEYIEHSETSGIKESVNAFIRPFDLSRAPLVRVGLIQIEANRYILIVDMHHIITDGISETIIIKEFTELYRGNSLPLLQLQYKDFSEWQRSRLESEKLLAQESFWLHYLAGPLPVLHMSLDYSRPTVLSFEGDKIYFQVGKSPGDGLNVLMKSEEVTLFMVLLSIYYILLNKYTGQQDIIIGSVTTGRDHRDLAYILGLLVETIVIRNYPAPRKPFLTFLREVKENTLNAFENQGYPFRELTKKLDANVGVQRNPLFDVMLIVQNYDFTSLEIEGLTFSPYPIERKLSKLDLCLTAREIPGAIDFELEYSTRLYKRETMEHFSRHFVSIMENVLADPGILLADIEILSLAERDSDNNNKLEAEFEF